MSQASECDGALAPGGKHCCTSSWAVGRRGRGREGRHRPECEVHPAGTLEGTSVSVSSGGPTEATVRVAETADVDFSQSWRTDV